MFLVKKVRFKNFRSYGNIFTEVDLMRNNTTVITAKNGNGKTSIRHAITFALFGKVPGINKNTLVNNMNNKDCVVEVECSVNGKEVMVRRGIKPAIFDIYVNGEMVDQSASSRDYQKWFEESVLGFNLNSFNQVVSINGSDFVSFLMMPSGMRRKMVEDLLSIGIFSKMHLIHTGNVTRLKEMIRDSETDIAKFEATIKSLKKGLQELNSRDADMRQMIEDQIAEHEKERAGYQTKIEAIDVEIASESEKFDKMELAKLETKLKKMQTLTRDFATKIKGNDKFIDFMKENTTCPTCQSDLDEDFRNEHICKREASTAEVESKGKELQAMIDATSDKINSLVASQKRLIKLSSDRAQLEVSVKNMDKMIRNENLKLRMNEDANESTLEADIIKNDALLQEAKDRRTNLLIERQYLELNSLILKDSGIKSRIITKIIPRLKRDINHFISLMELNANFEMDENFNEVIYTRFKDPVSYANLSAGERSRVDIAMMFAWREVAKTRNSLNCNLLFLDEIFDSTLDGDGLDLFVNLLKNHLPNTNVFLISHRPEVVDKFESNMRIEKKGNFSVIV